MKLFVKVHCWLTICFGWYFWRRNVYHVLPSSPQKMKDIIGCVESDGYGGGEDEDQISMTMIIMFTTICIVISCNVYIYLMSLCFTIIFSNHWSPLSLILPLLLYHIVLFTCNYTITSLFWSCCCWCCRCSGPISQRMSPWIWFLPGQL